eukprot:scaffold22741_cov19-Tisochrysis_lutea.AAC.4
MASANIMGRGHVAFSVKLVVGGEDHSQAHQVLKERLKHTEHNFVIPMLIPMLYGMNSNIVSESSSSSVFAVNAVAARAPLTHAVIAADAVFAAHALLYLLLMHLLCNAPQVEQGPSMVNRRLPRAATVPPGRSGLPANTPGGTDDYSATLAAKGEEGEACKLVKKYGDGKPPAWCVVMQPCVLACFAIIHGHPLPQCLSMLKAHA